MHTDRQAHRHTGPQTDRHTQTGTLTDRHTHRQAHSQTGTQMAHRQDTSVVPADWDVSYIVNREREMVMLWNDVSIGV